MGTHIQIIDPGKVATKDEQSNLLAAANMLAKSDLIPEAFRNRPANCALAIDYAQRLQVAPLFVMQNLYVHKGRLGWMSDFVHGMGRKAKVLRGPLMYEERGTPYEPGYGMRCYGTDAETGDRVVGTTWVTPELVRRNGWDKPSNSGKPANWATMPEIMYPRRAATFFFRERYPEILMGLPTQEEVMETLLIEEQENRATVQEAAAEYSAMARRKRDLEDPVDVEVVERDLEAAARDAAKEAGGEEQSALTLDQEQAIGEWCASDEVDANAVAAYCLAQWGARHYSQLTAQNAEELLGMLQSGDFAATEG